MNDKRPNNEDVLKNVEVVCEWFDINFEDVKSSLLSENLTKD